MTNDSRNNGGKTGKPTPPVEHQFKPGNPGRQKGSRNKLGELFLEAMHADFETHGPAVIEKVRTDKPDQYLKIVASILPKDLNVSFRKTDELSDDELIERIRLLDASIKPFLAARGENGADERDPAQTEH
jgi:hypothetical protein